MGFEIGKGLKSASRIGCGCTQKLGEFVRSARCKTTKRSTCEAGYLAESLFTDLIVTFLEHKRFHVAQPKLSGAGAARSDGRHGLIRIAI